VTALPLFGLAAVSAMLLFYALEDRRRIFILYFAAACLASSAYGFLQGAWPFGLVEAVWTGVVQRWHRRRPQSSPTDVAKDPSIACDMCAFTPDERARYSGLRERLMTQVIATESTSTGVRWQLEKTVVLPELVAWMALERRCCPFLRLGLQLPADGTVWVDAGGGPGVKDFLAAEFKRARTNS